MNLSDYRFDLPTDLIAQEPAAERDSSRMLVIDRNDVSITDSEFSQFPKLLRRDDLLVLNNTKVFPARLIGRTETGAKAEVFLIEEIQPSTWLALAKPGRRLGKGKCILFSDGLTGEVLDRSADGKFIVQFSANGEFGSILNEIGRTPLPPYIHRDNLAEDQDRERYQTVYASRRGAIAAPTAGLHFSERTVAELNERGVEITEVTLHVGYGTFEPVRETELAEHKVAPERFEIDETAAQKLERARKDERRIVAVGTTTSRTLEFARERYGSFKKAAGYADLTIRPGHRFMAVGALLTNFHLPESSLLILVATFGGYPLIMDAYRHAVASRYRFYSYGDCMFIQ